MSWWEWLIIGWGAGAALTTLVFCGACTVAKHRRAIRDLYADLPEQAWPDGRPPSMRNPGDGPVFRRGADAPDRRLGRPARGSWRLRL